MRYIKEIIIKNFQSHKDTHLQFVNGLNTIIGESDKGKSAVIRAIKWVILNEPQGNGMVREGTNEAYVTIVLNNDIRITRGKKLSGKKTIISKNTYKIEYPNGDISENENFGVDALQEVLDACGIKILKIDKDLTEIPNFLFQLEAPFLVASNGAVRSKTIGKLINANLFDAAIRDIKSDVTDIGRKVKEKYSDYESLTEKLKEYENIEEEEKKLNQIEKSILDYENRQNTIEKLKEYISSFSYIKNEKFKLGQVVNSLSNMEKGELYLKDLELKHRENKDLNRIKINIDNIYKNKKVAKNLINNLKFISSAEQTYQNLFESANNLGKISSFKNKLDYLNVEKDKSSKVICEFKNIENIENIYSKLREIKDKKDSLDKFNKSISSIKYEKIKLKSSIDKFPNFEILEELYKRYDEMQLKIEKIIDLNKIYIDTKDRILKGKTYLYNINNNLLTYTKDYSKSLQHMGKCPTCFNNIDNKTIENIIKSIK